MSGQVRDEATAVSVSGVTVSLLDSTGVLLGQQTTEGDGRFALSTPAPGNYRLRFQVPGYRLLVTPLLELRAGERLSYPLTLRPLAPAVLDTLLVEGRPDAALSGVPGSGPVEPRFRVTDRVRGINSRI